MVFLTLFVVKYDCYIYAMTVNVWVVAPCDILGHCECFGGTLCLHLHFYPEDCAVKFLRNGNNLPNCVVA